MIRWTQLLQSLVADTKLGPQLQLWRSDPHSTPLALFRGSKIFAANQAALDYFACVHQEILNATLYDFAPRLQLGGQSSIELAKNYCRPLRLSPRCRSGCISIATVKNCQPASTWNPSE